MGEYYEYNTLPVILYACNNNSQKVGKVSKQTDNFYEVTSKTKLHSIAMFTHCMGVLSVTNSIAAHCPPSRRYHRSRTS
jgi:hypothetical protein